ncbi:Imm1 family immunity protein [Saccharopolyspora spinosa]|uniref:Immunity protein Imm1 of predicted polymorphic toxin system n=1 Tax=Saccharopolyspora spinosa TaxID=60894 RepID=A0A2N3XRK4_SACSN|nr:Imm1 family immunity protein [Saccharopolyspora spinosa]PKW13307.1 immunity protein Imm1 of predicted polymorphic toxin system [Saccharopolyspora spinosa]
MTFTVMYHPDELPAEITTVAELDDLLDRVTADAIEEDVPTYAEIVTADRLRILQIGLGQRDYSSLIYCNKPADILEASKGTLPMPDDAGFDYGGTWTDAPINSAIPITTARQAARDFLSSDGHRPANLEWHEPQYGRPEPGIPGSVT